ncbi:MAG: SMI1/KNR4 family protein [Lachnospiraceae bacterium]|nr:SMI1/KNR4 family protein [Lachnospiraceae bacterium]
MKFYKKAKELMDMEAVEYAGGTSKDEIECAMKELSVVFPESYRAFLSDFGAGDVGGEIIFGITDIEEENVVKATKAERSVGLPDNFIIISYWEDTFCCLDISRMRNNECPVVELSEDYKVTEIIAESFGQFLYDYENDDES